MRHTPSDKPNLDAITSQEITEFASILNHNKMHDALVQRAEEGDPKAMLALSKNDEEAKVAIEKWLGTPLLRVNLGTTHVGQVQYVCVRADTCNNESTGDIRVYGYPRGLRQRGKLTPSFELALDEESAKTLAEAILRQV